MEEFKALKVWKASGRGETMMSTFEYKTSHDKMFIEGYRFAKDVYFNEEPKPQELYLVNRELHKGFPESTVFTTFEKAQKYISEIKQKIKNGEFGKDAWIIDSPAPFGEGVLLDRNPAVW